MLSKEEIENYELFKSRLLQQPISLLTKENLERLQQHSQKQLRHEVGQILREHEIVLELIYRYKQLESDKQKLVEKLEEDHKQHIDLIQEQYNQYSEYYARTGGYPNQMKQDVAKLSGEKNKIAEYLLFMKGEKDD